MLGVKRREGTKRKDFDIKDLRLRNDAMLVCPSHSLHINAVTFFFQSSLSGLSPVLKAPQQSIKAAKH